MIMENHSGVMSTGENIRALWQSYQKSHLVANQEDLGEENDGFVKL
jgi:hypothetical protein